MLGLNLANRSAHTTNALIELVVVVIVIVDTLAGLLFFLRTHFFVDKMADYASSLLPVHILY